MIQYFPKPQNRLGGNIKAELDLSNYATKSYLKGATGTDTPNLPLKSNFPKLQAVGKRDSGK